MKPLNLKEMREQLMGQLAALQGSLRRTVVRMKDDPGNHADILDQAATEQERALELAIRFRDSRQIQEIREAIRRIDQGRFGVCYSCGKAISPRRLLLAPLSRLCASCKARLESGRDWRGCGGERMTEHHAA
jgi:DnaK suppressor protein